MGEPIQTVGDLAGMCGYDGTDWEKVLIDATKRLVVACTACALPTDAATETTLANIYARQTAGVQPRLDDHVVAQYSDVPGDTNWHDLVNVTGAGTLEWMTAGDNWSTSVFRVTLDGDYLYMIQPFGAIMTEQMRAYFLTLGSQDDSLWKLHVYDAPNYRFYFFLKRPVFFGSSLQIEYKPGNAAAKIIMACGYHLR